MNEEEKKAIEKLTNGEKITLTELIRKIKKEGIERFIVTRPEYVYIILNLIEKLQRENELAKQALIKNSNIADERNQLLKDNQKLREYIAIAPNLDEMTATKYRNIRQDAYIQGRAEEQQKAEQIIYENYIPKQTVKDKIEILEKLQNEFFNSEELRIKIIAYKELIEEREDK